MIICYCSDCNREVTNEDLLYIIKKGEYEDGFIAEYDDIKVYRCQCGNKIYA